MFPNWCKAVLRSASLSLGLSAPAAFAGEGRCTPVPGVENLLSRPGTRIILFGEVHGTAEIPAFFADVVCHAAKGGREVFVGLEHGEHEQKAIEQFMLSDATQHDPPGRPIAQDGRYSQAMTDLLISLRTLKKSGANIHPFAFSRAWFGLKDGSPDGAMASALRDVSDKNPNALVLTLTGSVHAAKTRKAFGMDFTPAAAMLPASTTLSLNTTHPGGWAWNCSHGCQPNLRSQIGVQLPRGIQLQRSEGFDGRFSVGTRFTASPPSKRSSVVPTTDRMRSDRNGL